MNQQVCVLDGDGLAVGPVLVGEADVVALVAVGLADLLAGAELVDSCGVGDILGDGESEAVCVGLAEALAALSDEAGIVAEIATVNAWLLTVDGLPVVTETTLPAGDPSPPVLPYTRNPTTAMPAKPPVSISPIPRRFSPRRGTRDARASSAERAPRPRSSSAATGMPRRPPPADLDPLPPSFPLPTASTSETTEGRGRSERRPRPASSGSLTRSPSYGVASGTGSRPGDLAAARPGPSAGGICTVARASCTLESSSPVAPQPGQDTAPLRYLRQVLQ